MNAPINLIVRRENAKARAAARKERLYSMALGIIGIVGFIVFFALPWPLK